MIPGLAQNAAPAALRARCSDAVRCNFFFSFLFRLLTTDGRWAVKTLTIYFTAPLAVRADLCAVRQRVVQRGAREGGDPGADRQSKRETSAVYWDSEL